MADTYLKLFVDCLERYQKLNDAEFGRLIRAALRYKATGEEVKLVGREELLWDGIKLDIDRDNKTYQDTVLARSEAGRKGSQSRWGSDGKNSKNNKCHIEDGKNGKEEDKDKEEDEEQEEEKDIPPQSPQGDLKEIRKKEKQKEKNDPFLAFAGDDRELLLALQAFD